MLGERTTVCTSYNVHVVENENIFYSQNMEIDGNRSILLRNCLDIRNTIQHHKICLNVNFEGKWDK